MWQLRKKLSNYLQSIDKVDNLYLVTFAIRTPIFEWHLVWGGSENGCQKDRCLKEIGPRAQNMIINNYN